MGEKEKKKRIKSEGGCTLILKSQSNQLDFNVHIQNKLLKHTPVMGTQSSYQLDCLSRTEVSS